jgi:hypothetical protein
MKTLANNSLVSLPVAVDLINSGAVLSVAGSEEVLDQLPRGNWIGGTSPYFTTEEGGVKSLDRVFVTRLAEGKARFARYAAHSLADIVRDAPDNGFSFVIIPAGSTSLQRFSEEGRYWTDIFLKPVVGWIAGIDLSLLGKQKPKVYDGSDGSKHEDSVIVIHVALPPERIASIETINIFERDTRAVIRFSTTASEAVDCTINGQPGRLAEYFAGHGNAEGKLPLIGDFGGASINVSVQATDPLSGRVTFYAPVFPDVEYYLAKPVGNYASRFAEEVARHNGRHIAFSCNCILNFLYGGLEGKHDASLPGPVTFGEIAYLLHNQTMVMLKID